MEEIVSFDSYPYIGSVAILIVAVGFLGKESNLLLLRTCTCIRHMHLLFLGGSDEKHHIEGRMYLTKKKSSTFADNLAFLTAQYSVYPGEVLEAMNLAKEQGKAVCQDLTVEFRGMANDEAIFLITRDKNVVMQFRVPEATLKDESALSTVDAEKLFKQPISQDEPVFSSINSLRAGMKRVNVEAEVFEVTKPEQVSTQYGNTVMMAKALVGDETGKVKLCLWDAQIGSVAVGYKIQIKNAQVCNFKGEMQLRLGRNGTLTTLKTKAKAKTKQQTKRAVKEKIYA